MTNSRETMTQPFNGINPIESRNPGESRRIQKNTHVKRGYRFNRPQPGCHLPNSPRLGKIKLFPAKKSLISDIPAGDAKTANIFYSVQCRIIVKLSYRRM
jgi:hypothetical protein